jgi:hypothetical protein
LENATPGTGFHLQTEKAVSDDGLTGERGRVIHILRQSNRRNNDPRHTEERLGRTFWGDKFLGLAQFCSGNMQGIKSGESCLTGFCIGKVRQ